MTQKINKNPKKYLGWTNHETWNVMLWINNIEDIYFSVVEILKNTNYTPTYREIIYILHLEDCQTADGISFLNHKLNYDELNNAIKNIGGTK